MESAALKQICRHCGNQFPEYAGSGSVCVACRPREVDRLQAEIGSMEQRGRIVPVAPEKRAG